MSIRDTQAVAFGPCFPCHFHPFTQRLNHGRLPLDGAVPAGDVFRYQGCLAAVSALESNAHILITFRRSRQDQIRHWMHETVRNCE